ITASPGRTPRARRTATLRATSARMEAEIAEPSMTSAGKVHRPRLADDYHLDLSGILELRLDAPGDFLRQRRHADVVHLIGTHHHAHFTSGLDGEDLFHAAVASRNLLDPLETFHVGLERLATGTRPRARDGIRRLD